LELTGHAPEELTSNFGVEYGRIIHPDDRDIVWGRIQEAIEKKESFQIVYRIITRDGRTRWVWERGRAVLSSDGCARRIEGFISDITERKRTEEELVRLFAAVEHAAGAILIHDPDLTVRYVNPAYEKISGYPAEEILGKRVGVLNPDQKYLSPQELEEIVEKVQAKGKWVGRMERSTKQGRTYAVEAVISPILDSGNGIAGYAEFWRDVTQEEELQKQLIQAQKMEAIGTLAGGIAHDFNNILASIMGFSELAQIKASGNQALQRDLGMILKASDRAKDLVGQILAFSRKTEYKKRSLRLGPLFRECIKMLRATIPSTVEIDLSIQTSSDLVVMDAVQMHQVLTNLCSNAAHAMPDGGSLRIRIKEPSADKQLPPFATPGEYVQIEVEDTGFGMHKDVLDRIFDPFFTTKKPGEGTGMGLSVVHGIIKKHKGHVAVTTEPGKGTLFTILLPRGKEDSKSPPDRGERTGHKGGGRVLYVDDEKTLVYMADRMLRNLGYSVRTSRDSMEALEWVVQDPHSFDLVITDQVMPRLTGIEFANEIKRIRKDLPVLLISGFSKIDPDRSFSQTGVEGFLQKPFRQHELAAAIQSIFETETNHKQQ
ncbi:MAG: PAS domain S-box protein, partial [Desulfovibrionales bacterium]